MLAVAVTATYLNVIMMAISMAMASPKLAASLALRSPSLTPLRPMWLKPVSVHVQVVGCSGWRWQELEVLLALRFQLVVLLSPVLSEPLNVDFSVLGCSCT